MNSSNDESGGNSDETFSEKGMPLSLNDEELKKAEEQLELWKSRYEKCDTEKSRLLLDKLSTEDSKRKSQEELCRLLEEKERLSKVITADKNNYKKELQNITEENNKIKRQNQELRENLTLQNTEYSHLQQMFMIEAEIPEKKVKFTKVEKEIAANRLEDACMRIDAQFSLHQKPAVEIQGGQALITFEEESVAQKILKLPKCVLTLPSGKVDVKPSSVSINSAVKFEINYIISRKQLVVCDIPCVLEDDRMKDKIEISFSKPSQGGGEIENVNYNKQDGMAVITFLQTGVAERLAKKRKYTLDLGTRVCSVPVHLHNDKQIKKFQAFGVKSKRTVLLSGINNLMDDEELQDCLEIYFQKPINSGGEVQNIKYVSKGNSLYAFFEEDIVEKEQK
ncbi:N-myc-interactor [Polypterus senegalus]|uniref:N-myc-interactor n=1 Tax=Polypterus senegalus TaxID=55291 RepID=UPI001965F348|nr:N-myc-interactor [Polypterus senegalus]